MNVHCTAVHFCRTSKMAWLGNLLTSLVIKSCGNFYKRNFQISMSSEWPLGVMLHLRSAPRIRRGLDQFMWTAWITSHFFYSQEVVHAESVRMSVKRFYGLTAKLLSGEPFSFSALKGKVVLIENVASLWGTTTRDYTQMNELHSRYSNKGLVILGVPCNQFGHQVG